MSDACWHEHTTPVENVSGQIVAQICVSCDEQLPAAWGCPDCHWDISETHLLSGDSVLEYLNRRACDAHRA